MNPSHMSPPYRAILWDNDGVLVDTERWYFQSTRDVLAEAGVDLTEALYFEHFLASANGTWHLATARGLSDAEIAGLQRKRNERYQHALEHQPLAIPGVRETLQALRPHFTMGIVTSSRRSHFETIHRRTGFMEFFDFALTADDCERCKPDPDPYLQAIARSGFPAGACLAIEDAPRGVIAARAAGIDCWVIPTALSRLADFSGAARVLNGVTEVASFLLSSRVKTPVPYNHTNS
jgi:HAD superfamily hydrolase (TIGR01509 family)